MVSVVTPWQGMLPTKALRRLLVLLKTQSSRIIWGMQQTSVMLVLHITMCTTRDTRSFLEIVTTPQVI